MNHLAKLVWITFFIAGCGTSAGTPVATGVIDRPAPTQAAALPEGTTAGRSELAQGPSASESALSRDYERRADDEPLGGGEPAQKSVRPGLGTGWGETRVSPVRGVRFYREAAPFAMASVYYNDLRGVVAQASTRQTVRHYSNRTDARGGAVIVQLEDESGNPFDAVYTSSRTYVVGENGARYIIHVRNETSDRVEVVATVDGLDVISGQDGSLSARGYLVEPWGDLRVEGFRRSENNVAAFRFVSTSDSYAEARGKGRNVGVIGFAFFGEAGRLDSSDPLEIRKRETANPFPNRFAPAP